MTRLLLAAGLLVDAARWHWGCRAFGYWLRPYCWRLDRRHGRWAHHRCRCAPDIVVTLTVDATSFEQGIRRAADRAAKMRGSR